jgi:DNA modification methylase
MKSLAGGCCDLIYIDPPFNTGRPRRTQRAGGGAFQDHWGANVEIAIRSFLQFLKPRITEMHRLLPESGSIFVHVDWRTVHHVRLLLDEVFDQANFLNEIIWQYRTGGNTKRWFARKHDTILWYAKISGRHTFHSIRAGTYRTDGINTDASGRLYKSTRNGPVHFHPDGPLLADVWDIPFLSTVATERLGYPTQKPERLLERVIEAASNPGDVVGDFFAGSGTTAAVAKRMQRDYLACDINPQAVKIITQRLAC